MPSKFEYELTKLRGKISESGEVYTASIAALQDALTVAEKVIESLISEDNNLLSKANRAQSTGSRALSKANSSVQKHGDILKGIYYLDTDTFLFPLNDASHIGSATQRFSQIHGKSVYASSGLSANTINEWSAATGVTIDTVLIKDGDVDGRDVSVDGTKLDGVEVAATADQTGAEIKTAYEAQANAYTDTKNTKLNAVEALADVTDATNVEGAGAVMFKTANITIAADNSIEPASNYSYIRLETNGGAATDNLNHVHLTNYTAGDLITFTDQNAAHDVTIQDNSVGGGLIYTEANASFVMAGTKHCITFIVIDEAGTKSLLEYRRFNG